MSLVITQEKLNAALQESFQRGLCAAKEDTHRPETFIRDWAQQVCLGFGFVYTRASDDHYVECTKEQAVEFMGRVLGVRVDFIDGASDA